MAVNKLIISKLVAKFRLENGSIVRVLQELAGHCQAIVKPALQLVLRYFSSTCRMAARADFSSAYFCLESRCMSS